MIDTGRWPADPASARKQNLTALVSLERIRKLAPNQPGLYLLPPPFRTVAECVADGEVFWDRPFSDPQGLDRTRALVIGDFGLGSDAPIVLDFRYSDVDPAVLYLRWNTEADAKAGDRMFGLQNRWSNLASSFERFVEGLGL